MMAGALPKGKVEYFPANYAQAISKLVEDEEESIRLDFISSVSLGLATGMAPHVEWVREKLLKPLLHPDTSPKMAAVFATRVVQIYTKYGSKSYKLFLNGDKTDWEWLDKQLTAQIQIFEADVVNHSAVQNIGRFYATLNEIFDMNEQNLRSDSEPEDTAITASETSVDTSQEPLPKKSKKNYETPIFSRLNQPTSEEDAQMRKHLLLWSIFENAHSTSKAVQTFSRGMIKLLQLSQNGAVSTSLATTLGKFIDCIVRFRHHDDLLPPIAESLSDTDVLTTARQCLYNAMADGEGKLHLVDHLIRAFDFTKENLPLEGPPSVDKFIGVILLAKPFACVQKKVKDVDPVDVGVKYSYFEQALFTFHYLACLLALHESEVRTKSQPILEGLAKLRSSVHSALRQNPRSGQAAEELFSQMELLVSCL